LKQAKKFFKEMSCATIFGCLYIPDYEQNCLYYPEGDEICYTHRDDIELLHEYEGTQLAKAVYLVKEMEGKL